MLSDSRGTLSVLNWMELDEEEDATSGARPEAIQLWRGHRVAEFIDPEYLGRSAQGISTAWGGGASWKPSDPEIFGATYGSKWHIWSQKSLQGGKPIESGDAFPEGGHRFRYASRLRPLWHIDANNIMKFRWCPTNPRLFAVSTTSPLAGAVVKVFDVNFPKGLSTICSIGSRLEHSLIIP